MPSRPNIPPHGTPLARSGPNSVREVFQAVARRAASQAMPGGMGGIITADNDMLDAPASVQVALFQVISRWSYNPPASEIGFSGPETRWASAQAYRLDYYPGVSGWDTQPSTPELCTIYHPAGYQLDSVDPGRVMPHSMGGVLQSSSGISSSGSGSSSGTVANPGKFMPGVGVGEWCWCLYDELSQAWLVVAAFEDIVRVRLTQNWYACSYGRGTILIAHGDTPVGAASSGSSSGSSSGISGGCVAFDTGYVMTLFDAANAIADDNLAEYDTGSNQYYIPAGTWAVVKRFADSNAWEPLRFVRSCTTYCSSSSSGSSSSGTVCNRDPRPRGDAPYITHPVAVWGVDANGCYGWVAVSQCSTSSGSSSSSGF